MTCLTIPLVILTIYSLSITLNLRKILLIFNVYPLDMLNTENTSDEETSFIDLNIKSIDSNIHTSAYDAMTSDFQSQIFS